MRAEWHACLHRNSMHGKTTFQLIGLLVLPQRFDWTKGFCTLGVVASLCATAPTSPTAVRSRLGSTDSWLLARSLAPNEAWRLHIARVRSLPPLAAAPRLPRASDRRC